MYNKLKLKFKSGTKGIVKSVDPKREDQVNLTNFFKLIFFFFPDDCFARTFPNKIATSIGSGHFDGQKD